MTRGIRQEPVPSGGRAARIAALVVLLMIVAALAVRVWSGQTYVYLYNFAVTGLAFGPLGALILSRRPRHSLGRLFLALAAASAVMILLGSIAVAANSGLLAIATMVLRLGTLGGWGLAILLFPTGSAPSPRWRPVGWTLAGGSLLLGLGVAVFPGHLEDFPTLRNPIGLTTIGEQVSILGIGLVALGTIAATVSVVFRFTRAHGDERQQLKIFALAAASTLTVLIAANIAFPQQVENTVLGDIVWGLPLVLLPAAVAAAILRYGLYDIDRIISRTLAYGILSACLVGLYAMSVFLLGSVLPPMVGSSDIIVAVSTLIAAAAFSPLRKRVQSFIDRRFNRARYDAARTIQVFSSRLREDIDLASVTVELTDIVRRTMEPASVSMWVPERPRNPGGTQSR